MTTFTGPLKVQGANNPTGNSQTDTSGYVHCTKIVDLVGASTAPRAIVSLPQFAYLTNLRAFCVSGFAADVSAVNVSWGNSSDATRYGIIAVSAVGAPRSASVSGAFDFYSNGGTIVIVGSAVSTTTFTSGAVKAFVEYIVTE